MNMPREQWIWWRLARAYNTTPHSIQTTWSLYEVLDAHEVLDLEAYAERVAYEVQSMKRPR